MEAEHEGDQPPLQTVQDWLVKLTELDLRTTSWLTARFTGRGICNALVTVIGANGVRLAKNAIYEGRGNYAGHRFLSLSFTALRQDEARMAVLKEALDTVLRKELDTEPSQLFTYAPDVQDVPPREAPQLRQPVEVIIALGAIDMARERLARTSPFGHPAP